MQIQSNDLHKLQMDNQVAGIKSVALYTAWTTLMTIGGFCLYTFWATKTLYGAYWNTFYWIVQFTQGPAALAGALYLIMRDTFSWKIFESFWMVSQTGPYALYWVAMYGAANTANANYSFISTSVWPWFFGICFFNIGQMFVTSILSNKVSSYAKTATNYNN